MDSFGQPMPANSPFAQAPNAHGGNQQTHMNFSQQPSAMPDMTGSTYGMGPSPHVTPNPCRETSAQHLLIVLLSLFTTLLEIVQLAHVMHAIDGHFSLAGAAVRLPLLLDSGGQLAVLLNDDRSLKARHLGLVASLLVEEKLCDGWCPLDVHSGQRQRQLGLDCAVGERALLGSAVATVMLADLEGLVDEQVLGLGCAILRVLRDQLVIGLARD